MRYDNVLYFADSFKSHWKEYQDAKWFKTFVGWRVHAGNEMRC